MNTTNKILLVIAIAVVIIAGVILYQWIQQEQEKQLIRNAIEQTKQQSIEEVKRKIQEQEENKKEMAELKVKQVDTCKKLIAQFGDAGKECNNLLNLTNR